MANLKETLMSISMKPYGKLTRLLYLAYNEGIINEWEFDALNVELDLLVNGQNRSHNTIPRGYIEKELDETYNKEHKMTDFKKLPSNPAHDGIQYTTTFQNGYGASIVQHSYSYGGTAGLWELAVIGKDGYVCYDTEITNDVLGYLTEKEVNETLDKIAQLV